MSENHIDNLHLFNHLWKIKTKPKSKPSEKREKYQKTKRPTMTKGKSKGKPMIYYLSSPEKLVALCIAHHRNPATLRCFQGYGTIAAETGLDKKTIGKAVESLERAKIIWRYKVYDENELKRTQYFFMYDANDAKNLWEDEDSPMYRAQITDGIDEFIESLEVPF